MKFKKIVSLLLTVLMLAALGACASDTKKESSGENSSSSVLKEESKAESEETEITSFTLAYPADMQALGYTDPVVLDTPPKRIACMSTYPVMALYELGAPLIAVPSTSVLTYPDDLEAEILPGMMSDDFDLESVVSLEPDLVIMPTTNQDTYGATLEGLGIPVYYVAISSQTLPVYEVVKSQTQALVDAFSLDESSNAAGEALMGRFTELENRLEELKPTYEGKTVMVLVTSDPTTHYLQTENGTLGSMLAMLGFTNVYENDTAGMVPLDMENALEYDPDLLVFTGGLDQAGMEALVQETFDQNPDYWNSISAVANGDVICLPSAYVSTAGINILNNIQDLMDTIAAHYDK